jgi:hypothetical protein
MDIDSKLMDKEPLLPKAVLDPRPTGKKHALTTGRNFVLSIALTALSFVASAIILVVPILFWSLWSNIDIVSEIKAFIQEHPSDELGRLGCMVVVVMFDIILFIVFPIFQKMNHVPSGPGNVFKLRSSWKRTAVFALYAIAMTGGCLWSNWNQYVSLVEQRIAKGHSLFGKRAEEAFL